MGGGCTGSHAGSLTKKGSVEHINLTNHYWGSEFRHRSWHSESESRTIRLSAAARTRTVTTDTDDVHMVS